MKTLDKILRFALLAPFVVAMIIHGSTKPPVTGSISYQATDATTRYLYDNGSYVSTNLVHIAFTYTVAPGTADFQLWAWPLASTNEEDMVCVYTSTLALVPQPYEFEYQNAISNRWIAFTTWTPGPTIHTNGVAQINWQLPFSPAATNKAVMLRTGIYIDSRRLGPDL